MELDLFFYIFGIISIILILMVIFVLRKSTNRANLLFVLTPLLFTTILIFNMINYYGDIINNFILWIPYLLAPLGMFLSSLYILYGPGFHKRRELQGFVGLYIVISLAFSYYPNPFQFGGLTGLHQGIMHLYLIIPFIGTIYFFSKIIPDIPDQKEKIYSLICGLLLVAFGSVLRSYDYISMEQDSTLGMIIIVVGSIFTLLAFASVRSPRAK